MEADQGWRLAGIEVADDGVANLPMEVLKRVGLGVDRRGSCAGPEGTILRLLDHEKDFLHSALQYYQSDSGGWDAAPVWAKGLGRHSHTPGAGWAAAESRPPQKGSQQGQWPDGPPKTKPGPVPRQPPASLHAPARAQDVARRILASAWWTGFTFNGITRCEKGTVDLVGGEQLSDRRHLLALNRQACSRHWLNWHDCRQHGFQGLLGQLQIMAGLHPQP